MCTAITFKNRQGETFFGRTMDFSYPLDPQLYVVPQGSEWENSVRTLRIRDRYSFLGIGQDISPVIFADGVNEMGLAAAALYFPGYADYGDGEIAEGQVPVGSAELVRFFLGSFASVSDVREFLPSLQIVGMKDAVTDSVAPLHWILYDRTGACLVIERTASGMEAMDNFMGVLANSPELSWHLTNLRNYMNLTQVQYSEARWGETNLTPFGQGVGTLGLPGDYTSPSRFVRAAFLKTHVPMPDGAEESVLDGFHILESVSIPKGAVITARGTADYTQYTAMINVSTGEYFFRTYDNSEIVSVNPVSGDAAAARAYGKKEPISLGRLARPVRFWSL